MLLYAHKFCGTIVQIEKQTIYIGHCTMKDICKTYRNDEAENQMVDASIIRPMNGM